jgi:hypothetical protein
MEEVWHQGVHFLKQHITTGVKVLEGSLFARRKHRLFVGKSNAVEHSF